MRPAVRVLTTAPHLLILSTLIVVALVAPGRAATVDLELRAADLSVTASDGEVRLVLPGAHALRHTGRPELPARAFTFAVAPDRTVVSAGLVGGQWVRVPLDAAPRVVEPLEPFEARGLGVESVFSDEQLADAVYYPPVEARPVGRRVWHGQAMVTVEVYPVRVDARGDVWLREGATLDVTFGPADPPGDIVRRERALPGWDRRVTDALRRRVVDPTRIRVDRKSAALDAPVSVEASAAVGPTLDSRPVQHLILTTSELAPSFQRLADHRNRLGMSSLVVTVEDVLATTRKGVDLAETLRNYVRDAYSLWGVDYLLLGGDTQIVPTRYVRNDFYPSGSFTDIPTDLYYGGLDGNWNADGDAVFGEHYRSSADRGDDADFDAEVSVGRATVTTVAGAEAFVDKVIAYEIPATTDWQHGALLASEVLFPLGWKTGDPVQLDGAFLSEALIDSAFAPCAAEPWNVERHYEIPENYPAANPVSPQGVIDALDTGNFGVFHHVGHGFYFNMSVGPGALVPADADGLTNGPNYFLLYSLNCSSSAFDFNCLNERFVRNPQGGAMASLGSSRAAFPSAAKPLQEEFYRAWLCEGVDRVGDIYTMSRQPFLVSTLFNTVQRWTQMVYTLLGDPAMPLFRDEPVEATIAAPSQITLGNADPSLFVFGPGGVPLEGVTVSATKNGEDTMVATTGPNGSVALDFAAESPGDIAVWASGQQIVPTSTTVTVVEGSESVATVQGFALDDDANAPSDGNDNGRAEAGERVALLPTIGNATGVQHPGGDVLLRLDDPYVTVVDSLSSFGVVAGSSTVSADTPVTLEIDPAAPDGHAVELRFLVDDGGGQAVLDLEALTLEAAELEVVGLRFDDGGDGIVTSGESATVLVDLKNYGAGSAEGLTGSLVVTDGDAIVDDTSASWPAIEGALGVASTTTDAFGITVNGDASAVSAELTVTDSQGRTLVHPFDLVAPPKVQGLSLASAGAGRIQIEWSKSAAVDLMGYRVYRRADGAPAFTLATPDVLVGSATFFDEGLDPLTTFDYAVSAVDSGGVEGPLSDELAASTNPPEISCFPLPLGLETSGALAISDVDDDGVRDMVIGAETVYLIDGECQEPLDGDNDAQTFGPIYDASARFEPSSITLGDLDPNRRGLEIVAMNRDTRELLVLDGQGNVLPGWPQTLANWAWGTAVVGDLDGDGTASVPDNEIVINDLSGFTYAFHHDGTEVADGDANPSTVGVIAPRRQQDVGGTTYTEFFGRTTPALFDVDGDGSLEILFGSKYQNANAPDYFYALRTDGSGTNAPGWPKQFAPQSVFLASPSLADIDRDGVTEIIAPCENDSLYVWEPDGSNQPGFPVHLPNNAVNFDSLTPSPAVGNFDADADLEFVAVGITRTNIDGKQVYRSTLKIYDPDGTVLAGWPVVVEDLSESSPVVGDVDGDGQLDVVYGIGGTEADDALFAFTAAGEPVRGFPIPINGFVRATPTLTDFDQNGTLDLALATWDRLIHVWDTGAPYDPALAPWPTFRGNVNRSGVFGIQIATSAPAGDTPGTVRRAVLSAATPNPFNPRTTIGFALDSASDDVRLEVFDVQGRRVRTLAQGGFAAGRHSVDWSGLDTQGRTVASGVYYAVLEVDGERVGAQKMALVK
ncbi:MAG TPA: C25 family cysteine peptidase [Candidatus Krumholzibacteria bacterium]|nr:C25 family cysteine peptidase [Candidatus Krumholzibacteria bacterium]